MAPIRQLAIILADTDALWSPMRDWKGNRPANTWHSRCNYVAHGVPWRPGSTSSTGRTAAHRALEGLAEAGHVEEISRPADSKFLHIRLTDQGEKRTRRQLNWPGPNETWSKAQQIASRSKRPADQRFLADRWIIETDLFAPGEQEHAIVQVTLLPALVHRLVESHCSVLGHAYYALSAAGWRWLDAGVAPPVDDDLDVDLDESVADLYVSRLREARDRLGSAEREVSGEIGGCPLPSAIESLPLGTMFTPSFG